MDSFFDDDFNQLAQPAQGGFLDQLLANPDIQPSAGFPALPQDANAAMPAPAPQQPQNAPIAVGDYSMPRIGSGFDLPPGQLDPNTGEHVATAPVQQPAAPALPAAPFAAAGDHLNAAQQSLQHGGGLLGGLSALITGQRHDPWATAQADQQAQLQQKYKQLIAAGVSPQIATIYIVDPEAGKALIAKQFGPPQAAPQYAWDAKTGKAVKTYDTDAKDNFQVVQTGENGLGAKTFQKMNKADGTMTPIAGAPDASSDGIGDMSLSGDAYRGTVPKKELLQMDGMHDGTISPPSSFMMTKPYMRNLIAGTKNLYPDFDETNWPARRKLNVDLASSGNSSMGGILSNGGSSFSHLAELSGSMSGLGNASHDYPGGGAAAYVQNYVGNKMGGSDTKAKIGAINDNLGHYGQESTKFYSGTGGGAEERMNALKEMDPTTTSSEEMASYVEKEKSLMLDRLNNKFQQIRDTYGEEQGNRIIAKKLPDIQRNIATIDANIARLRGGASGTATGGTAPTGVKWSVVQ